MNHRLRCLPSGHVEAVIFLTDVCKVNPHIKDRYGNQVFLTEGLWWWLKTLQLRNIFGIFLSIRWGNAPIDDAMQFNQDVVVSILEKYQSVYDSLCEAEEQKTAQTAKSVIWATRNGS